MAVETSKQDGKEPHLGVPAHHRGRGKKSNSAPQLCGPKCNLACDLNREIQSDQKEESLCG